MAVSEILFEFIYLGRLVRVAAVCSDSLVEVVLQAPATTPRHELEQLARRKLEAAKRRLATHSSPRLRGSPARV